MREDVILRAPASQLSPNFFIQLLNNYILRNQKSLISSQTISLPISPFLLPALLNVKSAETNQILINVTLRDHHAHLEMLLNFELKNGKCKNTFKRYRYSTQLLLGMLTKNILLIRDFFSSSHETKLSKKSNILPTSVFLMNMLQQYFVISQFSTEQQGGSGKYKRGFICEIADDNTIRIVNPLSGMKISISNSADIINTIIIKEINLLFITFERNLSISSEQRTSTKNLYSILREAISSKNFTLPLHFMQNKNWNVNLMGITSVMPEIKNEIQKIIQRIQILSEEGYQSYLAFISQFEHELFINHVECRNRSTLEKYTNEFHTLQILNRTNGFFTSIRHPIGINKIYINTSDQGELDLLQYINLAHTHQVTAGESDIFNIIDTLLTCVNTLHEHGLLHLDIKLENIAIKLINEVPHASLIDLESVFHLEEEQEFCYLNKIHSTLGYVPPDARARDPFPKYKVSRAWDMYAIGLCLLGRKDGHFDGLLHLLKHSHLYTPFMELFRPLITHPAEFRPSAQSILTQFRQLIHTPTVTQHARSQRPSHRFDEITFELSTDNTPSESPMISSPQKVMKRMIV